MQGYVACVGFQRCAVHYITLGSGQGNILTCVNIVSEVGQALGCGQGNALAGLQHLVVIQGAMFCLEDNVAGGDVHARAVQALSIACFIGFGFFTCCIHQAVEIIVVGQIALDCFQSYGAVQSQNIACIEDGAILHNCKLASGFFVIQLARSFGLDICFCNL